jgi:ABC-type glycerol-3-phosphate transport system substrate-binding protein
LGSFTNTYDTNSAGRGGSPKKIEVWISTGRDTYEIVGRMINESFASANPDVSVEFKLVSADVIFPASLTGHGPDVVLQTLPSTPINFGFRDGAVDLTQFSDFEEIAARFAPSAIETLSFNGAVYALPDQMTFNVLFYRKDVFERLCITVPQTMKDFLAIVPILQKNYMEIYFTTTPQATLGAGSGAGGMSIGASTRNLNPVYASFLSQMGGRLYTGNGVKSDITSDIAVEAFKYWTELYTKHNFIVDTDFVTRFRVGEVPVGVYDLWQYNTLNVSAPEIKGNWGIAPIPGLTDEHGNVRRENPISVDGSLIVKNIAERNGTVEESWRFLKWFTSEEAQYRLATEVQAVWGENWRYQTANLAALERIGWDSEALNTIQESIKSLVAIPQVPGGYITGRVVENAFLSVVSESTNANPTDAIFIARDQLDSELRVKRIEFGIE